MEKTGSALIADVIYRIETFSTVNQSVQKIVSSFFSRTEIEKYYLFPLPYGVESNFITVVSSAFVGNAVEKKLFEKAWWRR